MSTPICGLALILTFFLREYSLERKTVQGVDAKSSGDLEKGTTESRNDEDLQASKPLDDDPDMTPTNTVAHPEEPDADEKKVET